MGKPTTYANVLKRLDQTQRAQGTRLYVLVAIFAGLIALVSIASALAQQTGERRREAASLRSVGVRARAIAGAYRREAVVLATATFVGTAVAAWMACRVLLPALPLVLGLGVRAPAGRGPASVVHRRCPRSSLACVVGVATFLAFRGVGRASPPRILREDPS